MASKVKEQQYVRNLQNNKIFQEDGARSYRLTPFIVTFGDVNLTSIDMENFIEMGLRIIRFNMTKLSRNDKITLLAKFKQAVKIFCEKYDVKTWPISICIDLPNLCIKTGCISEELEKTAIHLKENDVIEMTCDTDFWNKCNKNKLFMDDPYTFKLIKPGTEITLGCGKVIMSCTEIIDEKTIRCKIHQGGFIGNLEFVCVRGIKHTKPALSKYDLNMIEFAKEFSLDIIILNSVRYSQTVKKVKGLFVNCPVPQLVSAICEQEGLDNIDAIIEESDGIILAREFLAYEILNKYQMRTIQMQISAKCRQRGKPFFISGNILEESLEKGIIIDRELFDITNAATEGTGFVLRQLENPSDLLTAMNVLDSICKSIESFNREAVFWRILDEVKMPVNAAEACCLAGALAAKQTNSKVIIVSTVTGSTARHLLQVIPEVVLLAITCDASVARKLQLYRGIISVEYDAQAENDFEEEMTARAEFALAYCIAHNILKYKEPYILMRKASIYSAFVDSISVRTVVSRDKLDEAKLKCLSSNHSYKK